MTEATDGDSAPLSVTGSEADHYLAALSRVFNDMDKGETSALIEVSVVVGGNVFSGLLTGGRRWAIAEADVLRQRAQDAETGDDVAEIFDAIADGYLTEKEERVAVRHIHLRDAVQLIPGRPRSNEAGMPLRFQISAIQGWTIGSWGSFPETSTD